MGGRLKALSLGMFEMEKSPLMVLKVESLGAYLLTMDCSKNWSVI